MCVCVCVCVQLCVRVCVCVYVCNDSCAISHHCNLLGGFGTFPFFKRLSKHMYPHEFANSIAAHNIVGTSNATASHNRIVIGYVG